MEEIYGLFNELDSSQLNYVKAGEFLPDDYKIKYTKVVNEFIQYCAQFKLEPNLDESYVAINYTTIKQINHLHNSAVWFNYISTDYSYPVTFELLCRYIEKSNRNKSNPGRLITEYSFAINGENEFKTTALNAFKKELERWVNQ